MLRVRRDWEDMDLLQRQVERFVDHLARHHHQPAVFARTAWTPHVDMYERGDALVVVAELAGVNPNEVEISVEQGKLVIRGQRPAARVEKAETCHALEIASGAFERVLALPFGVVTETAQASYRDGMLTVVLPRRASRAHQVDVSFGEGR